jgi:preprotein translocase subunit SecA
LREEIEARTQEAFAELDQRKEYERDSEALLEVLEDLLEGLQGGRAGRGEHRMPLFPAISQALVERVRETIERMPEEQREEALAAELAVLHEQMLEQYRARSEERVARILARALYEEEQDEDDLHLTRLYRTLTKDLRIPLPATTTAARWARMEPQAVEEEVLAVVRREAEGEVRRLRPRLQEHIPRVIQSWKAGQGAWWTVTDYLTELDRSLRLPARPAAQRLEGLSQEEIVEELYRLGLAYLEDRERRLGPELLREIERAYLLRAIDREWVDYLTAMEDLRQGIGLRAYGQQDPLVEYRRESYHLFQRLLARVRAQALFYIFRASEAPLLRRPVAPSREAHPARGPKKEDRKAARGKPQRPQPAAGPTQPAPAAVGAPATGSTGGHRRRKRKKR